MPLQFSEPQICQNFLFWFEDFDYKIELDRSWLKIKKGLTSLTPACHWEQRPDQEDPGSGRRGAVTPLASGGTRLEGSAPLALRRLPRHVKIRVQRRRTICWWLDPPPFWLSLLRTRRTFLDRQKKTGVRIKLLADFLQKRFPGFSGENHCGVLHQHFVDFLPPALTFPNV